MFKNKSEENVKQQLEIKKLKNEIEFKESKIKKHSFTYNVLKGNSLIYYGTALNLL